MTTWLKHYVTLWLVTSNFEIPTCKVGGHRPSGSRDIPFFICCITSHDCVIEVLHNFIGGNLNYHPLTFGGFWWWWIVFVVWLTNQISNKPWARFEPVQNLSSGLVEWHCAVVLTSTLQHYDSLIMWLSVSWILRYFAQHLSHDQGVMGFFYSSSLF